MPKLKQFLKEDALMYANVEVEYVHGLTPKAYFHDEEGNEVGEVQLSNIPTEEVLALFAEHNFTPVLKPEFASETAAEDGDAAAADDSAAKAEL